MDPSHPTTPASSSRSPPPRETSNSGFTPSHPFLPGSSGPGKLKMKLKSTSEERAERRFRKEQKRLRKERKKLFRANGMHDDDIEEMEGRDRRTASRNRDGESNGFWTTPPRTRRDESITPPRKRPRTRTASSEERELDRLEAAHGGKGYIPSEHGQGMRDDDDDFDESAVPPAFLSDFLARREVERAKLEEMRFRQKLFDLMEDEEGPNDMTSGRYRSPTPPPYTMPKRWQNQDGNVPTATAGAADYHTMTDEEYAESIRYGMWRLKNKDEAERLERLERLKAEETAQKERERAERIKEERKRIKVLERAKGRAEEKRAEKDRNDYVDGWLEIKKRLAAGDGGPDDKWRFGELPWPVYRTPGTTLQASYFTIDTIRDFLYSLSTAPSTGDASDGDETSRRRRIVRDAVLRYHPDRFERVLSKLVVDKDKEAVREAAGRVSRVLNDLNAGTS